jgi:hypothetical protein
LPGASTNLEIRIATLDVAVSLILFFNVHI